MTREIHYPKGERRSWWARSNFCPMDYAGIQDGNRYARISYSSRYCLSKTKTKKHKDGKSQIPKVRQKLNLEECSDGSEGAEKSTGQ